MDFWQVASPTCDICARDKGRIKKILAIEKMECVRAPRPDVVRTLLVSGDSEDDPRIRPRVREADAKPSQRVSVCTTTERDSKKWLCHIRQLRYAIRVEPDAVVDDIRDS